MFNKVVSTHISPSSPAGLALDQNLLLRHCCLGPSVRELCEVTAQPLLCTQLDPAQTVAGD